MTKFKYNFYLDKRTRLKSGLYSITINLNDRETKERTVLTIKKVKGLEISTTKKDWLEIWENKNKKDSFGEVTGERTVYGRKHEIRTILKAKQDILNEIIERDDVLDVYDVKKKFYNYTTPDIFNNDVYAGFEVKVRKLETLERYKTAKSYQTTLNNLKRYNNNRPFRYTDINKDWLQSYEMSRRGVVKVSTVSIELRNLRTIYNSVKDLEKSLEKNYPFLANKSNGYSIPTAESKNAGLKIDDLKKIMNFKSDNWYLQMARDYWVFSYYARGINLKDIARMKKNQTDYIRAKTEFTTKKVLNIPFKLNEEQRKIVKKYKGTGKYLFDILDDNDDKKMQQKKIDNKTSSIAKQIKKLVKILDLPADCSMVWARHTYTTNVFTKKVNFKAISESLGHTSLKTTENYINSLLDDNEQAIDDALEID